MEFGTVENLNRLFPLTPALSLGEREKRLAPFCFWWHCLNLSPRFAGDEATALELNEEAHRDVNRIHLWATFWRRRLLR